MSLLQRNLLRPASGSDSPSRLRTAAIIHLFAAAHALTALLTRLFNYQDDIPLTLLTIAMLIIIALRRRLPINIIVLVLPVVTLTAFLSGVWLGRQLALLTGSPTLAAVVVTFLLSEFWGWTAWLFPRRLSADTRDDKGYQHRTHRMILLAAAVVLLLRIVYSLIFQLPYFRLHGNIYDQFSLLFGNTFATLTLLCAVVVFSVIPLRDKPRRHHLLVPALIVGILLFPLLPAGISYSDFPLLRPSHSHVQFDGYAFAGLYAVALLATMIAYLAATLVRYALVSQTVIHSERSEKLSEQYKYAKLKQQISPHFLFNSLSILDSLVQSNENERATAYIRKLAALYRYILKNENETLVLLDEELEFTEMYVDLLKERFIDGLVVEYRIPAEARRRHIVPCGLQMLIENATKHNAVSAGAPLRITVGVEADFVVVANNLQPRISTQPSSRLGLQNIDRQYRNIAGVGIGIIRTDREFKARLPLL